MLLDTYLERGARVLVLVDPASEPPVLTARRCTFLPGGLGQATVPGNLEELPPAL